MICLLIDLCPAAGSKIHQIGSWTLYSPTLCPPTLYSPTLYSPTLYPPLYSVNYSTLSGGKVSHLDIKVRHFTPC